MFRIIERTSWNEGKIKEEIFIEKKKKFMWWSWWSTITEHLSYDCEVPRDFESVEKAEEWIKGREDFIKHYGDISAISVVREL